MVAVTEIGFERRRAISQMGGSREQRCVMAGRSADEVKVADGETVT